MVATISTYLINRLQQMGLKHVFGIQGDYVLNFYSKLAASSLEIINTCDEQGAGFAADGYARIAGFGAACVTYGVGGLKLANSTAQSYAERCPVLVISGAPGVSERGADRMLHHRIRTHDTQLNIFKEMTVAQAVLSDAETAPLLIDSVLKTVRRQKKPGYIEIPRDMVDAPVYDPPDWQPNEPPPIDLASLEEVVEVVMKMLKEAKRPILSAGMGVHRYGLQDPLLGFLERSGIPFVSGVLGKSSISEDHPQFLGIYAGGMSPDNLRRAVEDSDCLILIGPLISDLATGMCTHRIDMNKVVQVDNDCVLLSDRKYPGVNADSFLRALSDALTEPLVSAKRPEKRKPRLFVPEKSGRITIDLVMACVDSFLDESTTVIAEPGDALFGSLDLTVHARSEYVSPAYYASIGYSVPASIGVQLADPDKCPLILTGDGSFQMTGMELSTSVRYGLSPIVVILNNGGYGTFRPMIDGPFNDIQPWRYAEIVNVIGGGEGYTVSTEDEFAAALIAGRKNQSAPTIIDVRLDKDDTSARLKQLTRELKKRTG